MSNHGSNSIHLAFGIFDCVLRTNDLSVFFSLSLSRYLLVKICTVRIDFWLPGCHLIAKDKEEIVFFFEKSSKLNPFASWLNTDKLNAYFELININAPMLDLFSPPGLKLTLEFLIHQIKIPTINTFGKFSSIQFDLDVLVVGRKPISLSTRAHYTINNDNHKGIHNLYAANVLCDTHKIYIDIYMYRNVKRHTQSNRK